MTETALDLEFEILTIEICLESSAYAEMRPMAHLFFGDLEFKNDSKFIVKGLASYVKNRFYRCG